MRRISFEGYDGDLVVKPIGLTGGKGVRIMGEQVDRAGAIAYARSLNGDVVLEERLLGEEFTLQAFVDGNHLVPMPLVQDHKRAFEGRYRPEYRGDGIVLDARPYAPVRCGEGLPESACHHAVGCCCHGTYGESLQGDPLWPVHEYRTGPQGDRVQCPVWRSRGNECPLPPLVRPVRRSSAGSARGRSAASHVTFEPLATVCKYLVPKGYPDTPHAGDPVTLPANPRALLYYANVEKNASGSLVTQTSRTLAYVGMGETLEEAERNAEQAASGVTGAVRYRRDIGTRALLDQRIAHMKELQ